MPTFIVIVISLAAGFLTWVLHHRLQRGPVLASAVVTLTAGLILPGLHEQGVELVPIAACASYVSMSATIRLRNVWETLAALVIAALIYVFAAEIYVGIGGKLGTIAAISVMTVCGCLQTLRVLPEGISKLRTHRLL